MFTSLSYITFYIRNFQAVVEFYRDTLGLEVEELNDGFVRFHTANDFKLAFHFADQPRRAVPAPEIHFAVPDVDEACRILQARGVNFTQAPENMAWGIRLAACRDPEGHAVEIIGPLK